MTQHDDTAVTSAKFYMPCNCSQDATMTGPIMEHMWAICFFATDGLGPALAKAATYKDVLKLQSNAPGLYMRLLTRVQSPGTCASVTDQMPTPLACLRELRTPLLVCMWSLQSMADLQRSCFWGTADEAQHT